MQAGRSFSSRVFSAFCKLSDGLPHRALPGVKILHHTSWQFSLKQNLMQIGMLRVKGLMPQRLSVEGLKDL